MPYIRYALLKPTTLRDHLFTTNKNQRSKQKTIKINPAPRHLTPHYHAAEKNRWWYASLSKT